MNPKDSLPETEAPLDFENSRKSNRKSERTPGPGFTMRFPVQIALRNPESSRFPKFTKGIAAQLAFAIIFITVAEFFALYIWSPDFNHTKFVQWSTKTTVPAKLVSDGHNPGGVPGPTTPTKIETTTKATPAKQVEPVRPSTQATGPAASEKEKAAAVPKAPSTNPTAVAAPAQAPAPPATPIPATAPPSLVAPAPEPAPTDPTVPKLVDNRWILQATDPQATLYRIPADPNPANPTTYAITHYEGWDVACESRGELKSCFASAWQKANQAVLHVRIGAVARLLPGAVPDYTATSDPIESGRGYRYVVSIQLPHETEPQAQVTLTSSSAIGNTNVGNRCDKTGCFVTFYTSAEPGILSSATDPDETMNVTVTIGSSAYVWSFPTRGLGSAIARAVREMTDTLKPEQDRREPQLRLPH